MINIKELELSFSVGRQVVSVLPDVEDLVKLHLLNLEKLTLQCYNVSPLSKSNWPKLSNLSLRILYDPELVISFPEDLQFPTWPLKQLRLQMASPENISFLAPFLQSCPELQVLILDGFYTREMAELIISSAPLRHLESVMSDTYNMYLGTFLETSFKKTDFPALTEIQLRNGHGPDGPNLLPLLAFQYWVTNLTNLELQGSMDVTADDLQAFLKASENGALRRFQLNQVPIEELLDGFRNRKLQNLEYLWLLELDCSELSLGDDLSNHFNVLVDCFPKLKYIKLSCDFIDIDADVDPMNLE